MVLCPEGYLFYTNELSNNNENRNEKDSTQYYIIKHIIYMIYYIQQVWVLMKKATNVFFKDDKSLNTIIRISYDYKVKETKVLL